MLNTGASSYLLKNVPLSEIEIAIKTINDGDLHLGREAQLALAQYTKKHSQDIPPTTLREKEVLKWLSRCLKSVKIGEKLFINPQTVDTHRKNLMLRKRLI